MISQLVLAFSFSILSFNLLSYGDEPAAIATIGEIENNSDLANFLIKRRFLDKLEVPEAKRICLHDEQEFTATKEAEPKSGLLDKRRRVPTTYNDAKKRKAHDELHDLGFIIDDIIGDIAKLDLDKPIKVGQPLTKKASGLLIKRNRPKATFLKHKAKKHKTPERHFDLLITNLFYVDKKTKEYVLDEALLEQLITVLSSNEISAASFSDQVHNATMIWWLVFTAYAKNKALVEIVENILENFMEINTDFAPSEVSYLTINLMMRYANTSFVPKNYDIQNVLERLLKANNRPTQQRDLSNQENTQG